MAHLLDFSTGKAGMTYIGETPWHGLGQKLTEDATIDQWRIEASLDWQALRAGVQFEGIDGNMRDGEHDVIYRSDNFGQLGIVSPAYKIVQPAEVMEFFRDLVAKGDMNLETAGSLDNGRKVWALAKTGQSCRIKGQDEVSGYLLLSTSFDGTLATRAQFTSVRVVCNNTLQISLKEKGARAVNISHSTEFDADRAKINLGIMDGAFSEFEDKANILADRKVEQREAVQYLLNVLADGESVDTLDNLSTRKLNIVKNIHSLFMGKGMGSNYASADGTAWGLVNAVTQYVDHEQGNNSNNRFRSGQFGLGAELKNNAFAQALQLVA